MEQYTLAIMGLCDALKHVCLDRMEDGELCDDPIEQVQDALNIVREEYEKEEQKPEKDNGNILYLHKSSD